MNSGGSAPSARISSAWSSAFARWSEPRMTWVIGPQQRHAAEPERAVGIRLADQVRGLPVPEEALALPHGPLVPAQAEPLEVRDDRLGAALDVPGRVGVVDPEEQRAAPLVREPTIRDRAQRAAEVQRARRARSEADADHAASLRRCATCTAARTRLSPC
jgi:hypothetical protein